MKSTYSCLIYTPIKRMKERREITIVLLLFAFCHSIHNFCKQQNAPLKTIPFLLVLCYLCVFFTRFGKLIRFAFSMLLVVVSIIL